MCILYIGIEQLPLSSSMDCLKLSQPEIIVALSFTDLVAGSEIGWVFYKIRVMPLP